MISGGSTECTKGWWWVDRFPSLHLSCLLLPSLSPHTCTSRQDGYHSLTQPLFSRFLSHLFVSPRQLFEDSPGRFELSPELNNVACDRGRKLMPERANEWGGGRREDHTPLFLRHSDKKTFWRTFVLNKKSTWEKQEIYKWDSFFSCSPDVLHCRTHNQ